MSFRCSKLLIPGAISYSGYSIIVIDDIFEYEFYLMYV